MRLISRTKEQEIVETLAAQMALIEQTNRTGEQLHSIIEQTNRTGEQLHSIIARQAATIEQQAARIAQLEDHVQALVIATIKRIHGEA